MKFFQSMVTSAFVALFCLSGPMFAQSTATQADEVTKDKLRGPRGHEGERGDRGHEGKRGPRGHEGERGDRGHRGHRGSAGPNGIGATGPQGVLGAMGSEGIPGATGASAPGGLLAYADFYALMPGDNSATVAVGAPVQFPQDGPKDPSSLIQRGTASDFVLTKPGTYQVFFQVSVSEPGQLVVALNSVEQPFTVVGRATGTDQIVGMCQLTAAGGETLSIHNALGNSTALTITPIAGGTRPVSAHLLITKIS